MSEDKTWEKWIKDKKKTVEYKIMKCTKDFTKTKKTKKSKTNGVKFHNANDQRATRATRAREK